MAKTTFIDVPSELEEKYYSDIQSGKRFISPNIRKKNPEISRKKKTDLKGRSYLEAISDLWNEMSDAEQQTWKDVDFHEQQHGWRTFVADQSTRFDLGLSGTATPNQYHQNMIGKITIEEPASGAKLIQPHPSSYFVYTKVTGKDSMYKPSEVTERLAYPFKIGISYKSDLTAINGDAYAKFYAIIRTLYQGQNLEYNFELDIPLSSNWNRKEDTLTETPFDEEPKGQQTTYTLYIKIYNARGTLLFDNVEARHSGSNWARGKFCNNIAKEFSGGFYRIPKYWASLVFYASKYGIKNYGRSFYGDEDTGIREGLNYFSTYPE